MRVLFATSERGLRGGERQMLVLRDALSPLGCEVALCAPPGAALEASFSRTYPCPMANDLDPRGALGLFRAARAFGADLVHAFTARAHALGRLTGRPLVVTRAVAYAAGKGPLGRLKYGGRARFIAISRAAARALEAAGVDRARIDLVPPAIALDRIGGDRAAARARLSLADGEVAIGCVAALAPEKGLDVLLDASRRLLARCPHRLLIIGEGAERPTLERKAGDALGRSVALLGAVDEALPLYAAFDLYVQPSREEGFGLAAAEAMAAGVPVVASATGGLVELVEEGVTGLLSPPGDVALLAARMEESLAHPEAARRRAEAARRRVREGFSPEAMAACTLAAYRRTLEGR